MPAAFATALAALDAGPSARPGRRYVFVPYDQLCAGIGPLAHEPPGALGIVLVENPWKAARRPYHKQKLALVLANLRHFALEQARRGVAVAHLVHDGPYRDALRPFAQRHGPLRVMEPAERELRADLAPLAAPPSRCASGRSLPLPLVGAGGGEGDQRHQIVASRVGAGNRRRVSSRGSRWIRSLSCSFTTQAAT